MTDAQPSPQPAYPFSPVPSDLPLEHGPVQMRQLDDGSLTLRIQGLDSFNVFAYKRLGREPRLDSAVMVINKSTLRSLVELGRVMLERG